MGREGVDSKFARARRNVDEIAHEVQRFFSSTPYRLERSETDEGDLVYTVRVAAQPPMEWALIIGDAVHNARSALDHLAYALVARDGGTPGDHTSFPIANGPGGYGDKLRSGMRGARQATRDAIRDLQPWRGGDDELWRLHRLDIVDKHRLLVAVGAVQRGIVLRGVFDGFGESIDIPPLELRVKALNPEEDQGLQDGDEVYRVMKAARDADTGGLKFENDVTFEVVFGDGEAVVKEPIFPTLLTLVDHAAAVVEPLVAGL